MREANRQAIPHAFQRGDRCLSIEHRRRAITPRSRIGRVDYKPRLVSRVGSRLVDNLTHPVIQRPLSSSDCNKCKYFLTTGHV